MELIGDKPYIDPCVTYNQWIPPKFILHLWSKWKCKYPKIVEISYVSVIYWSLSYYVLLQYFFLPFYCHGKIYNKEIDHGIRIYY